MNKTHAFSKPVLGQRTSPFLQEKLAALGCDEVFRAVPDRISSLLGIEVNQLMRHFELHPIKGHY